MALQNINIVELQALQRRLDAVKDVLPAQALAVDELAGVYHRAPLRSEFANREKHLLLAYSHPTHLGEDDDRLAVRPNLLERLAEDDLGRAVRVHVGRVERVDPAVPRVLDVLDRLGLVEHPRRPAARPVAHAPEDQLGDLEPTGVAEAHWVSWLGAALPYGMSLGLAAAWVSVFALDMVAVFW